MSIAAAVLDFYDDSKHELMSKVASPAAIGDTPISVMSHEQRDALPDSDFGLVMVTKRASVLRKYPVNDPGNAWLSGQYFSNTHRKLAFPARFIAASFIKRACDAYGVPTSPAVDAYAARADEADIVTNTFSEGSESGWMLKKLAQQELSMNKTAAADFDLRSKLPNEHFALVIEQGDGTYIRKYAMPDEAHVRKAADYFEKYASQLEPEHRRQYALSLRNRAAELGVELEEREYFGKYASSEWNPMARGHIAQRASLVGPNQDAKEVLNKLAASLSESNPDDVAEALAVFDQATGIDRYYGRGLADPYASTMGKVATGWSAEVEGHTLTESDLKKVASSPKLASYLGETFARQFGKNATAIFDSLPVPEKAVIKKLATGEL